MRKTKLNILINGERVYDLKFYARSFNFNRREVYRKIDKCGEFTFEKNGVKIHITRS